jgi:hypothetical protein
MTEIEPGTAQLTETLTTALTAKAPKLLELLGQPVKNGAGINETLQALVPRP